MVLIFMLLMRHKQKAIQQEAIHILTDGDYYRSIINMVNYISLLSSHHNLGILQIVKQNPYKFFIC